MRIKHAAGLSVVVGAMLGVFLTLATPGEAARNSSGTYSLPSSYNPVVTHTTIGSVGYNATQADVASEITNSLDRNGRGAMLAPLQLSNGTASLPSLTFASDPDSGLYRAGAGDIRMQVDATRGQQWTATGSNFDTDTLAIDYTSNRVGIGDATPDATLDVEQDVGGAVLERVQNLNATGYSGVDFASDGGVVKVSVGYANASAASFGGKAYIHTLSGADLVLAANGNERIAFKYATGNLDLSGQVAPASSDSFSNTLTKKNISKAWATVSVSSGTPTIVDGFNVTNPQVLDANLSVSVDFVNDFVDTNYSCVSSINHGGTGVVAYENSKAAGSYKIRAYALTTAPAIAAVDFSSGTNTVSIICYGAN
jgi:hypothetical protein